MSQNVSTNPKERDPLTAPTPIQPWSAEAEADKLMDDLFSDLDQILEGGNRLPTEPAKPEYVSLKPIAIPQITIPPAVKPPQDQLVEQPTPEPTDSKLTKAVETQVAPKSSSRPNRFSGSFEKFLLLAGFAFLGVSLLLLLASKKKLTLPLLQWLKPAPSPSVQKSQVSQSDAQFSKYMLRSLEVIDNKIKTKQQATIPPGGTSNTNPPPLPSPNRPLASSQPQRVIERVYIPVYPPQNPGTPVGPSSVVRPTVPTLSAPAPLPAVKPSVPSPASRRSVPSPSPANKGSGPSPLSTSRRSVPSPSPVARRLVPASPKAAAPAALPIALPPLPSLPPSVMVPSAPVTQSPTSATKHTLVGVLEQGDRSAAMFSVSGVTRYIFVGEAIGDSGWTLVSVANQEAVIRRNGEVRSVYAGQSF